MAVTIVKALAVIVGHTVWFGVEKVSEMRVAVCVDG
jgi:hypothetical protein